MAPFPLPLVVSSFEIFCRPRLHFDLRQNPRPQRHHARYSWHIGQRSSVGGGLEVQLRIYPPVSKCYKYLVFNPIWYKGVRWSRCIRGRPIWSLLPNRQFLAKNEDFYVKIHLLTNSRLLNQDISSSRSFMRWLQPWISIILRSLRNEAQILQSTPPGGGEKISLYLALKGSKNFRGTLGAAKTPYVPYVQWLIWWVQNLVKHGILTGKTYSSSSPTNEGGLLLDKEIAQVMEPNEVLHLGSDKLSAKGPQCAPPILRKVSRDDTLLSIEIFSTLSQTPRLFHLRRKDFAIGANKFNFHTTIVCL